jgi:hypothetical protein
LESLQRLRILKGMVHARCLHSMAMNE